MSRILITLALFTASCAGPNCLKSIDVTVEHSRALCEIAAMHMPEEELGGLTVPEWCDVAENIEPFLSDYLRNHCEEQ